MEYEYVIVLCLCHGGTSVGSFFLTVPPKMDKALINLKLNFLEKKIGVRQCHRLTIFLLSDVTIRYYCETSRLV